MAVERVVVGVDSPGKMSQDHYLTRVVKLGPARTSSRMYLPSDLGTKEKKYGDLLRTSKEKLALYIGTNYGDEACQE